jgi:hypothetical protein
MNLSTAATKFQKQATHPVLMTFWMWLKLPAAAFAGVGCKRLDAEGCATTVPYGWRSQNPFHSTYFAAQAMAAELSTGALVLLATANSGVPFSTLILDIQGSFGKKAVSTATFTCAGGDDVFRAVAEAMATGEPRTVVLETVGIQADGSEVSRFRFTWSVKAKSRA